MTATLISKWNNVIVLFEKRADKFLDIVEISAGILWFKIDQYMKQ